MQVGDMVRWTRNIGTMDYPEFFGKCGIILEAKIRHQYKDQSSAAGIIHPVVYKILWLDGSIGERDNENLEVISENR